MNNNRPVNLNLFLFRWPLPAITSILHRVSGGAIFLLIPLLLWMLQSSLQSPESFAELGVTLGNPLLKLMLWATLAALAYHLVAGCKHLLMDLGIGETLQGGKNLAIATLVISGVLILLLGVFVW